MLTLRLPHVDRQRILSISFSGDLALHWLQFLPVLVTGLVAAIGIRDRFIKREQLQGWLLSILTVASVVIGLLLTYQKLLTDRSNEILQSALNIRPASPFDKAILVLGIPASAEVDELGQKLDSDGNAIERYTIEFLLPRAEGQSVSGVLEVIGNGLPTKEFRVDTCGDDIVVEEQRGDEVIRYSSWGPPTLGLDACGLTHDSGNWDGRVLGSWIFEHIGGSTGHVIDVSSELSAQMVIDYVEQDDVLAIFTIDGISDMAAYQDFVQRVLDIELKFYQSVQGRNPIGDGCIGAYSVPLIARPVAVSEDTLEVSLSAGENGSFRRCELAPF